MKIVLESSKYFIEIIDHDSFSILINKAYLSNVFFQGEQTWNYSKITSNDADLFWKLLLCAYHLNGLISRARRPRLRFCFVAL